MSENQLVKWSGDRRNYSFDFSAIDEISVGNETLASATVTCSPSGLTIGTPSVTTTEVQVEIRGGTAGTTYRVLIAATTSGGSIFDEVVPFVVLN